MTETNPTAALMIIGNEILSGRTQDKNTAWLGNALHEMGIKVAQARVIRDETEAIIATVGELRQQHDYVFTTGGIGPTHDDITSAAIAEAFDVPLIRHPEAQRRLEAHYPPEKRIDARMKMADIPEGASLIDNPVSAAPGFYLENVYVLAGVPMIMQAMFSHIRSLLHQGTPIQSKSLHLSVAESEIASMLAMVQERFPEVEIGCYPWMKMGQFGSSVVLRSADDTLLEEAYALCHQQSQSLNIPILSNFYSAS